MRGAAGGRTTDGQTTVCRQINLDPGIERMMPKEGIPPSVRHRDSWRAVLRRFAYIDLRSPLHFRQSLRGNFSASLLWASTLRAREQAGRRTRTNGRSLGTLGLLLRRRRPRPESRSLCLYYHKNSRFCREDGNYGEGFGTFGLFCANGKGKNAKIAFIERSGVCLPACLPCRHSD